MQDLCLGKLPSLPISRESIVGACMAIVIALNLMKE